MEHSNPVLDELTEEQQRDWRDELTEEYLLLRVADKASAMARIERLRKSEESLARHAREKAGISEASGASEEDMISVGNKTTNYYQASQQASATSSMVPAVASGLSKAALVAAIIASGGVGSGLTVMLSDWLNSKPAAASASDTDTDTISILRFPE
jgi:hypothetical protein